MARPSVLIVDDHAGFRAVARTLLVGAGFEVVGEAADGAAALEIAQRVMPSIVVLDVQLPDLTGFDVARRLLAGLVPPRVVLISSRDAVDFGGQITASGAVGFITKSSLSADTLQAVLRGGREGLP